MFTITTITSNNSNNLELEISLEPKNRINAKCKTAIMDLKRRLTSTAGNLPRQGHNSNDIKGLIFKDFTSIKPVNISADKLADYPEKLFSVINHEKFQLKYVVLQGAISSADIKLFLKLILAELKNNITIEKIVLRNIVDINSLAKLKNINFHGRIKLCIEYNEETALNHAKNILSKNEKIEYILLPKLNLAENNQSSTSTHNNLNEKSSNPINKLSDSAGIEVFAKVLKSLKSDENDEVNSNVSNHSNHNNSYYASSDSLDGKSTDDEKENQSHKVEEKESITKNTTTAITQHSADQNSKGIENNVNQPIRFNLKLTSPEIRMNIIRKQLNELEPEIKNLRDQIKELRDKNSKLEQQNEEFNSQDKALKEENQRLKQTEVYAALVSSNTNESLDKKLFDQLIMQAAAADTWRQDKDILRVDNESLKAKNNKLQADYKFLQDENAKLNLEVGFLQNQNNKLHENIESLRIGAASMVAVINSLKAKEKELDVSQAEIRSLKTQIEVLSEILRREQEKIINSNSLSNNSSNYPVRNTSPQLSQSVNSSTQVGYNNAITNAATPPSISNQGEKKKRSLDALGTDSLLQPPSPKAQKLTSTSSPRNNNPQPSPFWNNLSSLSVEQGANSTTIQQPAEYSLDTEQSAYAPTALQPYATQQQSERISSKADQKKYVEIATRPLHANQPLVYSSEADQHASAQTMQGFYYMPELENRGHTPIGHVLPWSSAQANNSSSDNDTSSLFNSIFNRQK